MKNKVLKKALKTTIIVIVVLGVLVGAGFGVYAIPYYGKECGERWSQEDEFDISSDIAANFDIDSSKHVNNAGEHEFVILNLADVQLNSMEHTDIKNTLDMLKTLIPTINPDLITLTGDQVSGTYTRFALRTLCNYLDSTGIPWAPVFGNHDGEHDVSNNGYGDIYLTYKNCIFRKNAPELGVGNYLIDVTKNGNPLHTIVMMDSHSSNDFGYDYIWGGQIAWYEWAVEGIKAANGGNTVESTCFFHIPLVEYKDAWELLQEDPSVGGNTKRENICSSDYNNGFFNVMKEHDSTHLVVVGHDHVNNFYAKYEGITLAYGMKSGFGSYWDEDMIGGTTITIGQDGTTELAYHYYQDGSIVTK